MKSLFQSLSVHVTIWSNWTMKHTNCASEKKKKKELCVVLCPDLLERVHPEGHIHARTVGEEGGQSGLLKQSKDQDFVPGINTHTNKRVGPSEHRDFPPVPHHSLHALLEDRVPPGLADDQVCPLDDDDADEEGGVAGELYDLPLFVGLQ